MTRPDFKHRADTPELMDDPTTDYDTFSACLHDLERVNHLTLGYRPTLGFLSRVNRPENRPLRVLDAGSGHGDTLRQVARWAARRGIAVELTGVDLNPWSTRAAQAATPPGLPITYETGDVLDYKPAQGVDVIISALFAHHLDDAALTRFLRWMEGTARLGWFVNDLHRHPLPYHFFRHASRAMRMHRFVQHDGPVSITRGFVAADWRRLMADATIPPDAAALQWWMPFRLCVARQRA